MPYTDEMVFTGNGYMRITGATVHSPATIVVAPASQNLKADYYTDGVADDVEIQAAINTGNAVYLKQGTYDIRDEITIPSNTRLFGDGIATVLKANASLAHTKNILKNADTTNGNSGIVIYSLKLDGNYANRTTTFNDGGNNIYLQKSNHCYISNVLSVNAVSANIALGRQSYRNVISQCITSDSAHHNILVIGNDPSVDPDPPGTATGIETYENIIDACISINAGATSDFGVGIELATYAVRNTVTGCTVIDSFEGGIHCFFRSNHNTIVGNTIYSCGANGIVVVDQADYNTITGNTIKSSVSSGISSSTAYLARGGYFNVVADNIITDCGGNGVRGDFTGWVIDGNVINNCGGTLTSTSKHGIYSASGNRFEIINNHITQSGDRGITMGDITKARIDGNYIGSNTNVGVLFDYGTTGPDDCTISNNIFDSNGGDGLNLFRGANRCVVSNNISRSNTGDGIDVRGAADCVFSGNVVSGNSTFGMDLKNDSASVGFTGCVVSGNRVTGNTSGGIKESGAADNNTYVGNDVTGNTTANFASVGASNIVRNNKGWITENSGLGTVPTAKTIGTIIHGLSVTPGLDDISLTPTNALGSATKLSLGTAGTSQFIVNVNTDPGADATFAWKAVVL